MEPLTFPSKSGVLKSTPAGGSAQRRGRQRVAATAPIGQETGSIEGSSKAAEARRALLLSLKPRLVPSRGPWRWTVTKDAWSEADEKGFEAFVTQIGENDCETVDKCLKSPTANPRFHHLDPPRATFFADCADLPFVLRAYYAWHNGLPFSFSTRYGAHPLQPGHKGRNGNRIVERYDIVGPGPDVRLALPAVSQFVSTEHFRLPPVYKGTVLPDHYPVRVSRESIKPGTVIFDPEGHIAVVYKVTEDGRILYIDSHPDNSLTRGVYNREFARAEPQMGAGFKRWRPQRLVGAKRLANGALIGGRIVLARDDQLADWSDEQFYGNVVPRPRLWTEGTFDFDGQTVDFHDYVRFRLAKPGFKYNPLEEVRVALNQLCREITYRANSVDLALRAGVDRRPAPPRLPRNIYATQGDWEVYSTPSRDARLKTSFEEIKDEAQRFITLFRERSSVLDYEGTDLRKDLLALYENETAKCSVTYTRSDGSKKVLSFDDVKKRLFHLSFDPHHCAERRWGATDPEELKTCRDDNVKQAWYAAQDRLRNQVVRTYGEPMGWGLAELQNQALDIGIREPPDVDAIKVLMEDVGAGDMAAASR
jgi:hypothetical protein